MVKEQASIGSPVKQHYFITMQYKVTAELLLFIPCFEN